MVEETHNRRKEDRKGRRRKDGLCVCVHCLVASSAFTRAPPRLQRATSSGEAQSAVSSSRPTDGPRSSGKLLMDLNEIVREC